MTDKEINAFYHSAIWKATRLEVLTEQHWECQQCRREGRLTLLCRKDERSRRIGHVKFSRANVHHIKELKLYPELRLSKYYVDTDGKTKRNLEAICDDCHNSEHERFQKSEEKPQINEEKW